MADEHVTSIEKVCRLICTTKGIDPNGTGYAVTDETRERLGASYPLWHYQVPLAEAILQHFGYGFDG